MLDTVFRPTASTATSYALPRWWFHRLLGAVYVAAFVSLGTQIAGLAGRDGIVPAGVDDGRLQAVCIGGAACGALLAVGILPLAVLPACWAGWWWLSTKTEPFLSYQWDALLLEAGLLAIVLAPAVVLDRPSRAPDPPRVGVWLMQWLLFRLMFASGAIKLASGDPTWRGLTALTFHYETQPIPTPVAWYAHHLPAWFHTLSTAGTLSVELGAPFLIVAPRRARAAACAALVGLQAIIAITGNYAFFNDLAAALCLFMLDDDALSRFVPLRSSFVPTPSKNERGGALSRAAAIALAAMTVPLSLFVFAGGLGVELPGWPLLTPIARVMAPLRSVNSYGLFAVMTTERPEIVLEGSNDRQTWSAYEFKYKAGDVNRRPPWVAPHQPRLDWQMWFAALGRFDDEVWFQQFCARLLEGSPAVLRLLAYDPFGGRPPKFLRAVLYRYRFSAHGPAWWTRERIGDYSPVMSLNPPRSSP